MLFFQATEMDKIDWFKRKQESIREAANVYLDRQCRLKEAEMKEETLRMAMKREELKRAEREKVRFPGPLYPRNDESHNISARLENVRLK
jgi:hypothetical protein